MKTYDQWKTQEPPQEGPEIGQIECHACGGEGRGRDEDGPWSCSTCRGRGWLWEEELEELREMEHELA